MHLLEEVDAFFACLNCRNVKIKLRFKKTFSEYNDKIYLFMNKYSKEGA